MHKFKKTQLLVSLLLFILFALGFLFLYKQVNNSNEKAQQSEAIFQNEVSQREEIKSLNRSIDTFRQNIDSLQTHFAESADVVPFLDSLEGIAKQASIKAEISSVDTPKPNNTGLKVQVNASGSFSRIYEFITLLENSPYELEITGFNVQNRLQSEESIKKGEPSIWDLIIKIKLVSFIQ